MKNKIQLNEMRFFARHGVDNQERIIGNWFVVDLEISTDFTKAMLDDDLGNTISYAGLFNLIKEEMAFPSALLEHVGGRIVKRLVNDYSSITELQLKIAKQIPPIGADIKESAILISGNAEEFKALWE
ncbi:MAG: dihydroneopterin aldolase [Bacteroidales bacterium]|nr:dihydroneopterin aldolase [Bacteroidales bacterium]